MLNGAIGAMGEEDRGMRRIEVGAFFAHEPIGADILDSLEQDALSSAFVEICA